MLVVGQIVQPRHGGGGDLQPVAGFQPVRRLALLNEAAQQPQQLVDMARARGLVDETLVSRQRGLAHGLEEAPPVLIGVRHHAHIAVQRLVGPARCGHHARISGTALRRIEVHAVEVLDQVETHHGFVHRHLDEAALARAFALEQRRQNGMRAHQAASLVGGDGGQVSCLAHLAIHQIGQAAHALDHIVIRGQTGIRPVLAKAVQPHIDQARKTRAQRVPVQAQLGQLLRAHAVHEHVCRGQQRLQRLLGFGLLEVEHHAFFAAVAAKKHGRHALFQGRPGVARGIARGRLDLDDLGAIVRQHLAGVGAKNHAGKVQHAHARQGAHVR
ncbi:hypothetical protein SDC9_126674 [bioreactor metagenome]|uniref:Uncharacterized protein n=1 Tax=bioreactor metagenome TaxID=1076179 RepID=A0A645CRV9_9ZZZZ